MECAPDLFPDVELQREFSQDHVTQAPDFGFDFSVLSLTRISIPDQSPASRVERRPEDWPAAPCGTFILDNGSLISVGEIETLCFCNLGYNYLYAFYTLPVKFWELPTKLMGRYPFYISKQVKYGQESSACSFHHSYFRERVKRCSMY